MLGHRQRDAGDVGFLEAVSPEEGGHHCAGDAHDGTESIHALAIPVTRLVAPGPGGGEAHAHVAGDAGVGVGCVGGALLVAYQDVLMSDNL